jgi:hypothetical protein
MHSKKSMATAVVALVAAGALAAGIFGHEQSARAAFERQQAALNPDGYVSFGPLVTGATISFLRFSNVGSTTTTTFSIRYFGYPSGTEYTTAAITMDVPAHASVQKSYNDLSAASQNVAGPDLTPKGTDTGVIAFIKASQTGNGIGIAHVTYNAATGYFENASVCTFDPAFALDRTLYNGSLINVHSTTLSGGGYPSAIILHNPDATSRVITGSVYDAATGTLIGAFPSTTVPANGSVATSMTSVQTALKYTSNGNQQFNIVFGSGDSSAYDAVPTHAVTQQATGATFNLTMACQLNPVHPAAAIAGNGSTGGSSGGTTTPGTGITVISTQPDPSKNPSGS